MSKQVGLHVHSELSTLDGFSKVSDIPKRARELGQQAVGLTDHGECAGHVKFQKACREEGIKPLFGMEGYHHPDIAAAMAAKVYPKDNSHICLIAQDQRGLSNLWALSSVAYDSKHFYHRPMADPALLRQYAEGLYASDGCAMTGLGAAVRAGDEAAARQYMGSLLDIFGDRFYVELHTWQFVNPSSDDRVNFFDVEMSTAAVNAQMTELNQAKLSLADEFGIPFVVVNDCHHSWPEDWQKKDMANRINKDKGDQLSDGQKADHHMGDDELYFWMERHGIGRATVAQAIDTAWDIAESCTAEITPMLTLPTFTQGEQEDIAALIDKVEVGFKRRVIDGGLDAERYFRRMESELSLICERRFAGYFLTVADYVRAAKDGSWSQYVHGHPAPMRVGPGRGSAGGCLVSWLLGITNLDPIKYDLLFERFLNPDRAGYPDVDVDFPQSRLRGMYHYLQARHGEDHVCGMSTVGRNGAKGMLKDIGRAMKVPYPELEQMTKIIEQGMAIVAEERENADEETGEDDLGWDEILATKGGDLIPWVQKYPELFERIGEMSGVARNYGKHPSGILINDKPLLGLIPLRTRHHRTPDEVVTTQWDMGDIEEMGGVKFDLLGLRHLDTLDQAAKLVEASHDTTVDFESFSDADFSNPDIWDPIGHGHTTGLFQIETPGSTRVAMELKPRSLLDIAALISIVRPGVKDAGETERFLRRRAGAEPVTYDHPLMEPITSGTNGILVYQEQMIRAAQELAGFTPGEADDLRKVTAKKLADKIGAFEEKFRQGCLTNPAFMDPLGGDQKLADRIIAKIWASINASARYSFNKCASRNTLVRLVASGPYGGGEMTIGDMYRRLTDDSRLEGQPCWYGCPHTGYKGKCQTCRVWRQKFRDPRRGLRAWSLGDDNRLHPNRIVDVHHNGVRPVWRVVLADGNSITTTDNHRHWTPMGWREVRQLVVGDVLLVCGGYESQQWEPEKIRTTVGERQKKAVAVGASYGPGNFIDGGYSDLMSWTQGQEWVCSEPGCTRTKAAGDRIERAHLDGNRRNNEPSNLAMKCASHHKQHDYRVNGRRRRGDKGYPIVPTAITSIEYVGEEEVYDLEMADPYHSWVGDNIVTHNSHAMGYGMVSEWEAWLSAHYPAEYLTTLMSTDDKGVTRYVRDARRRGIDILPPDINESELGFIIGAQGIRYGLTALRGVAEKSASGIIRRRPYVSFEDFLNRGSSNKTVVNNLIRIGAFDAMEYNPAFDGDWVPSCRSRLMSQFNDYRLWMDVAEGKRAKMDAQERAIHLDGLWAKRREQKGQAWIDAEYGIENFDDPRVVQAIETELVGTFILADPLGPYQEALEGRVVRDPSDLEDVVKGTRVVVGGQITKVKTHTIAKGRMKGQEMAFLGILYNGAEFDVTVFCDQWAQSKNLLPVGAPVAMEVERDDRGVHLIQADRLDLILQQRREP